MKKYKIILGIIIFMLLLNVKAFDIKECTTEEMNRLKELANQVDFAYEMKIYEDEELSQESVYYKIKVLNFNEDLKLKFKYSTSSYYTEISLEQLNEVEFLNGDKLSFAIYSYTDNLCTDEILKTKAVNLPYYNMYYHVNKEKCSEYPEFKYCKENYNIRNLSFEEIDKLFDKYLEENNIEPSKDTPKDKSIFSPILIIIIALVIIVGVAVYFIVIKKKNKEDF